MNIFMLTERNGKINILMRSLTFSSGFEDVFFPMNISKQVQWHMKYNAKIFMTYLLHNHFICK